MSVTSGPSSRPPFAFYDPDSSCWRTYDITFFSGFPKFSETLPTSGSMRSGRLSEHPMSAPATNDLDSSWLLPTPAAQEPGGSVERHLESKNKFDGANRTRPTHLNLAVKKLFPSPSAGDAKGRRVTTNRTTAHTGDTLIDATSRLLPTPTAGDSRQSGNRNLPGSNAHEGVSLTDAIVRGKYLPTPMARLGTKRGAQAKRYENPDRSNDLDDAVAWMGKEGEKLLPTPRTSDMNGVGEHGEGGMDLRTAVDNLLPTPTVASTRKSRKAVIDPTSRSAPGMEQALELIQGQIPRELESMEEAPHSWKRLLPTPTRRDSKGPNQRNDETCLHGAISGLPSDDTNSSSDETPPTPPTNEVDSILDSWNS